MQASKQTNEQTSERATAPATGRTGWRQTAALVTVGLVSGIALVVGATAWCWCWTVHPGVAVAAAVLVVAVVRGAGRQGRRLARAGRARRHP